MRAIDKMVEWLESPKRDEYGMYYVKQAIAKARSLAAEKTDEATEKGLVEELREWVRDGAPMERRLTGFSDAIAEIAEILSRHTAPADKEPLAVDIIKKLVAYFGEEDCRLDHHGYCQAHMLETDCTVKKARAWLEAQGEKL